MNMFIVREQRNIYIYIEGNTGFLMIEEHKCSFHLRCPVSETSKGSSRDFLRILPRVTGADGKRRSHRARLSGLSAQDNAIGTFSRS